MKIWKKLLLLKIPPFTRIIALMKVEKVDRARWDRNQEQKYDFKVTY
jgi:hypothetical protein